MGRVNGRAPLPAPFPLGDRRQVISRGCSVPWRIRVMTRMRSRAPYVGIVLASFAGLAAPARASAALGEFVGPSGVVFAVAWGGVSRPDLSVLLGSYAAPYRRAVAQSGPTRRRSRRVQSGGAVVETWGHMRALHGRAWVPALIPPGVTLDEID